MTRLDRYIFRNLGWSLLAVTLGLAALIWLTQSLRFIELVLDRGLSFAVFIELTGLLLPSFFTIILPITTFVVVLFAYVRLQADRELVVMRSTGLSQWQLARPALYLSGLAAAVCMVLNLWIVPMAQGAFRSWQFEIRNHLAAVLVQQGVFNAVGKDLTVYARYRDPDGTLRGILVHDARDKGNPVTILAERGQINTSGGTPRVTLYDGVRQQVERVAPPPGSPPGTPDGERLGVLTFKQNSIDLAQDNGPDGARYRDARERSTWDLLHPAASEHLTPRELAKFRQEANSRMASPFTAISFGLIALATALTGEFRRHGGGSRLAVGIGVVVVVLAFGLSVTNWAARSNGLIPLIWVQALLPGVLAAWVVDGMRGLPVLRRSASA